MPDVFKPDMEVSLPKSENSPVSTNIETNTFEIEEIYPNSRVQAIRNSIIDEACVGW